MQIEASRDAIDDSATGTGRLLDNDSGVISMANATAAEGEDLTFTVSFTAGIVAGGFTVTLSYTDAATDGATSGTDYTPYNQTLSFNGLGSQSHNFTVAALADSVDENDETFTVTATPDAAGVPAVTATGTITNVAPADTTAPTVSRIERQSPAAADTNADSLTFLVTFSEDVENAGTADFAAAAPGGGTATTATVTGVQARNDADSADATEPASVFRVTVSSGNLAGYNGAVGLGFATNPDITDEADNALTATLPSGASYETYTVDNTAPAVALARADGLTTTLSGAFDVTVTFTEANGLATSGGGAFVAGDLAVTNGSAAVTGGPLVWTATVTPTSGFSGDVTVNLPAGRVQDAAGNDNTAAPQLSVPVDNTAPAVSKIERHDGSSAQAAVTNADTLAFRVTFSETVENVGTGDFSVTAPGGGTATTATATNVSGSGTQYVVTVSSGNLGSYNGTVGLGLATAQDIEDEAGNDLGTTLPTGTNNETYTVDNTGPAVALVRADGLDTTLSGAFDVTVTFTEANGLATTGAGAFAAGDLAVANGAATVAATSDPLVWTATVTPASGFTGDVTVNLPAGRVQDAAGNDNTAAPTLTVTIDSGAPAVVSIERREPAGEHTNDNTPEVPGDVQRGRRERGAG